MKTLTLRTLLAMLCLAPAIGRAGDIVALDLPALPAGKSITISFDTAVARPVTAGATSVSAQLAVSGANISPAVSDDPATAAANDPTVIALDNAAPQLVSGLSAAPNPALVGQPIQFGSAPADGDLDAISYLWDFTDGTTSTTQNPIHAFAAPGTYTVGLAINDGRGGVTAASVVVTVLAPTNTGPDDDGYDSFIEIALQTDPNDSASRPFGLNAPAASTGLAIKRLRFRTSTQRPKSNTLMMTGTIPVPAGFSIDRKVVILAAGQVVRSFTIDAKGRSVQGTKNPVDTIRFKKPRNGAIEFSLRLTRGSFTTVERENGLVRVIVFFNGLRYEVLAPAK